MRAVRAISFLMMCVYCVAAPAAETGVRAVLPNGRVITQPGEKSDAAVRQMQRGWSMAHLEG